MANNLFVQLIAKLNRQLSKQNIQQDVTRLENTPFYIRLIGRLDRNRSRQQITRDINNIGQNQNININAAVDREQLRNSMNRARQQIQTDVQNNPVNVPIRINVDNNAVNNQHGNLQQIRNDNENIANHGNGLRNLIQDYVNLNYAVRFLRETIGKAVDTVSDLNKAQTDLQIATGKTTSEIKSLMKDYNELAREMSSTTSDVTDSATNWLRTGASVKDTETLIQDSLILSKVGKVESAKATEYLVSAMRGYKVEAENVIGIVDKLSAVDLKSAANSGELAEAMSKTATMARLAGVDMDTLIGYIATVKDVTQDSADSIGNAFKSMFSRLRNIKINKFIDEDGVDISGEINDAEKVLSHFGLSLRKNALEFKDTTEIINDVASVWNEMSSVQQASIQKAFGNTYQAEKISALFENYAKAIELSETAANSAGTAYQKMEIYENSLEAATNRLQAAFESLASDTISTEFLTNLAKGATEIVSFIDKTKLMSTGLTALAFTGAIQGLLLLGTRLVFARNNMVNMTAAMNIARSQTQLTDHQIDELSLAYGNCTAAQQRLILSSRQLSNAQRIAILQAQGLGQAEIQAQLQAWGLATAEGAATTATFSLRGAMLSLGSAIMANPVGIIVTALTAATMAISSYNQKQAEVRQEMEESLQKYKEQSDAIDDLREKYIEICDSNDDELTKNQKLNDFKEELIATYGLEKDVIEKLNTEREKGLGLLDAEFEKSNRNYRNNYLEEYKKDIAAAQTALSQGGTDYFQMGDNIGASISKLFDKNIDLGSGFIELDFNFGDGIDKLEHLKNIYEDILNIKSKRNLTDDEKQLFEEVKKHMQAAQELYDKHGTYYETAAKFTAQNMLENYLNTNAGKLESVGKDTFKAWERGLLEQTNNSTQKKYFEDYINNTFPDLKSYFDKLDKAQEQFTKGIHNDKNKADIKNFLLELEEPDLDIILQIPDAFDEGLDGAKQAINKFKSNVKVETADVFNFSDYSDQIENISKSTKTLENALKSLEKDGKLSNDTILSLAKTFPEFSQQIFNAKDNTEELRDVLTRALNSQGKSLIAELSGLQNLSAEDQKAVNGLISVLRSLGITTKNYTEMLDDLSDKESLLSTIYKEMHSDGKISVSTYQKLIKAGSDYSDCVDNTNGILTTNVESIKEVIKKEIELEIQTLRTAMAQEQYNASVAGATGSDTSAYVQRITQLDNEIKARQDELNLLNSYDYTSEDKSENKKAYSNDLQKLKDQLEDKKITYEQFLKDWQALNDEYRNKSEEDGGITQFEWEQNTLCS